VNHVLLSAIPLNITNVILQNLKKDSRVDVVQIAFALIQLSQQTQQRISGIQSNNSNFRLFPGKLVLNINNGAKIIYFFAKYKLCSFENNEH